MMKNAEISKMDLTAVLQILLLNLEAGCTLEQSLTNSLGEQFRIPGNTMVQSVHEWTTKSNDKDLFRFSRLVQQYHQNGSKSTMGAFDKFLGEQYTMKMAEIKKRAERATIKLTLLLMLSLFSIILVVMTPVVIMLQSNL